MRLPFSRQCGTFVVLALGLAASAADVSAKDFDGIWSVNIVAEDESCPTHTIPVQVNDGTISFSGFGATATGEVADSGAIRLDIAMAEKIVKIAGKANGRVASGSWRMAPAGCAGSWTAQISE